MTRLHFQFICYTKTATRVAIEPDSEMQKLVYSGFAKDLYESNACRGVIPHVVDAYAVVPRVAV